jgi:hypothetical protein
MTKKHFIRLAEYIRDSQQYAGVAFTNAQIAHLADFCHEANPRFNRQRWIGYIKGANGKNGGKPLPPKSHHYPPSSCTCSQCKQGAQS